MPRVYLSIAGAIVSAALAIVLAVVVAKAQVEPYGFWGWLLRDPHVVPGLFSVSALCCVVALGQLERVRRFYWAVFSKLFGDRIDSKGARSELKILKADWGNNTSRESVMGILNSKARNALTFYVNPDAFSGLDPAPGDDDKYVEVVYSFAGRANGAVRRRQRDWIVLPEDSWSKQEADKLSKAVALNETLLQEHAANGRQIDSLKAALDEATKQRARLSKKERSEIEKAGVLIQCAAQADALNSFLEEIWHLYNDDKIQTEGALHYPLSTSAIPDIIVDWRHKELWRFRAIYREHIRFVKDADSNASTNVIDLGFPRDGASYLEVRRDLSNHAALLRERANHLLDPFLPALETR
jgi:hypothetical protein